MVNGQVVGKEGSDALDAATGNTVFTLSVDGSGNVYVSDSGNNVIKVFNSSGTLTQTIGSGTAGSSDANLTTSTFN